MVQHPTASFDDDFELADVRKMLNWAASKAAALHTFAQKVQHTVERNAYYGLEGPRPCVFQAGVPSQASRHLKWKRLTGQSDNAAFADA